MLNRNARVHRAITCGELLARTVLPMILGRIQKPDPSQRGHQAESPQAATRPARDIKGQKSRLFGAHCGALGRLGQIPISHY